MAQEALGYIRGSATATQLPEMEDDAGNHEFPAATISNRHHHAHSKLKNGGSGGWEECINKLEDYIVLLRGWA